MTLAHLTDQYRALTAAIEEAGGVITPETEQAMALTEGNVNGKLLACHHLMATLNGSIATLDAEIKRLQALKVAEQRKYSQIQFLVTQAVLKIGKREEGSWVLRTPLLRLRASPSTECVVDTPADVPKTYMRVKREPDKAKIKAKLATGAKVRGCRLQTNYNLSVK